MYVYQFPFITPVHTLPQLVYIEGNLLGIDVENCFVVAKAAQFWLAMQVIAVSQQQHDNDYNLDDVDKAHARNITYRLIE